MTRAVQKFGGCMTVLDYEIPDKRFLKLVS